MDVVDGLVIAEREYSDTSHSALNAPEPGRFGLGVVAAGVKYVKPDPQRSAMLAACAVETPPLNDA